MKPAHIAATLTAALLIAGPVVAPAQSRAAQTVSTSGSGRLKRCWDLLLNSSCRTHHVQLPDRISVGDTIELDYGSNPKRYRFHIIRIEAGANGRCVLKGSGALLETSEKIEVDNCLPASGSNDTNSARP
jgi:hypothetical protein